MWRNTLKSRFKNFINSLDRLLFSEKNLNLTSLCFWFQYLFLWHKQLKIYAWHFHHKIRDGVSSSFGRCIFNQYESLQTNTNSMSRGIPGFSHWISTLIWPLKLLNLLEQTNFNNSVLLQLHLTKMKQKLIQNFSTVKLRFKDSSLMYFYVNEFKVGKIMMLL